MTTCFRKNVGVVVVLLGLLINREDLVASISFLRVFVFSGGLLPEFFLIFELSFTLRLGYLQVIHGADCIFA